MALQTRRALEYRPVRLSSIVAYRSNGIACHTCWSLALPLNADRTRRPAYSAPIATQNSPPSSCKRQLSPSPKVTSGLRSRRIVGAHPVHTGNSARVEAPAEQLELADLPSHFQGVLPIWEGGAVAAPGLRSQEGWGGAGGVEAGCLHSSLRCAAVGAPVAGGRVRGPRRFSGRGRWRGASHP